MQAIETQRPLAEIVYESLVDAICEGSLASGERLTQDEIANRFNVSRLPVGQALTRLEAEGFLTTAGRRGLKVAPLAVETVREIYEFRAGVDQVAAGLAARRIGSGARPRGNRILERGFAAARARDVAELVSADSAFHHYVYELAGNSVMRDVMTRQWHHIRRIMLSILGERRNQENVWHEHAAILDAICAEDVETAERLAREHVENASGWLREALACRGNARNGLKTDAGQRLNGVRPNDTQSGEEKRMESNQPVIRVLMAKVGLDGHDRGVKIVARALRDAGMDVVYSGLHRTPEEVVEAAVQEDVDILGVSILSGAHMTVFPKIIRLLEEKEADDIIVAGGGVIPDEDVAELEKLGVKKILLQDTPPREIVDSFRKLVAERGAR